MLNITAETSTSSTRRITSSSTSRSPSTPVCVVSPAVDWWSNTEQQSCSSLRGAADTVDMTMGLGSDTPLGRLGMFTPRGMLGKLGRLGMVMPRGRLGGLMPLGSEPSSAGTVGNLGRVPGISAAARGLMGYQVDGGGYEGDEEEEEEEVGDEGGGGERR